MRIINNYGTSLLDYINSDKSVKEVLSQGVTGTKLSAGAKKTLEKHGITLGNSSNTDTDHSVYESINKTSESLRKSVILLTDTQEDSLFAEADRRGSKTDVKKVVDDFITDYNGMLDGMAQMGGDDNEKYAKELSALVANNEDALSAIGITADRDGKLRMDAEKFEAADIADIKKAFAGDSTFAEKVAQKSIYVTANALSAMYSSMTANYTSGAGYASSPYSDATMNSFLKSI